MNFFRVSFLLAIAAASVFGQKSAMVEVCKQATFAAFKSLPKMRYECPEESSDSEDKILKLPARNRAIRELERALELFSANAWWNADVNDLNACEIHGREGKLSDDETEKVKQGDYSFQLFGNHQMRLVLLADPCYQIGYAGSNAFLLYRKDRKVFVSQVLDGYYSRVANSVGIDFANLNGRQLIEISTANSFPPSLWFHYFVIDPKTNKAVPKRLFKEGAKLTNDVYSAMLMGEPKDFGLPKDAGELKLIRNGRLAPTFSAYEEDEHGKIDNRLRRIIYRWNGRFYVKAR